MLIDGPAGQLEAIYDESRTAREISAILCHPHPQYGGSMYDAVLETAATVLLAEGVNCLRFNFRGVGASAGRYDNGVGEVDDLLAAHHWLATTHAQHEVWWLGYSFGSAVVWRALQKATPKRALLIAPPVGMMDFAAHTPATPLDNINAIAGDRDNFVDATRFANWPGVTTHVIPGADHFFSASHAELAQTIKDIVTAGDKS